MTDSAIKEIQDQLMKSNFSRAVYLFEKAKKTIRLEVLYEISLCTVVLIQPISMVEDTIEHFLEHGNELDQFKVKMVKSIHDQKHWLVFKQDMAEFLEINQQYKKSGSQINEYWQGIYHYVEHSFQYKSPEERIENLKVIIEYVKEQSPFMHFTCRIDIIQWLMRTATFDKAKAELKQLYDDAVQQNSNHFASIAKLFEAGIYTRQSNYDLALQTINQGHVHIKNHDYPRLRYRFHTLKAFIYRMQGNIKGSIELLEEYLSIFEGKVLNPTHLLRTKNQVAKNYRRMGEYEKALTIFETIVQIAVKENSHVWEAGLKYQTGYTHFLMGSLEKAEKYYDQCLGIALEHDKKLWSATYFLGLSSIYRKRGLFDLSLEYIEKAEELLLEESRGDDLEIIYLAKSENAYLMGKIQEALDFANQALKGYTDKKDEFASASIRGLLGKINHLAQDYPNAQKYFDEALDFYNNKNDIHQQIEYLFSSLQNKIALLDFDGAKAVFDQLENRTNRVTSKLVDLRLKFANALMMKHSKRMREKARALDQFEEIVNGDILDIHITNLSLLHLCELLFGEYKAYGEESVKNEIQKFIEKLQEFAIKYEMKMLNIRVLFLKANFEAIIDTGQVDHTLELLHGLIDGISEIDIQQKNQEELQQLRDVIRINLNSNSPAHQKIKQSNIDKYLKHAMRVVEIDSSDLHANQSSRPSN